MRIVPQRILQNYETKSARRQRIFHSLENVARQARSLPQFLQRRLGVSLPAGIELRPAIKTACSAASLDTGIGQCRDPARRQVHIDEQFHAVASMTSRSSERHAA